MEKTVKNCSICNQIGQNRCPEHVVVDHFDQKFHEWVESDNVVRCNDGNYITQCSQYTWIFTQDELADYFYKEYYKLDYNN